MKLRKKQSLLVKIFLLFFLLSGPAQVLGASWSGPDGYGYVGTPETYTWVEISSTGTTVLLNSYEFEGPIPVGFSFQFYESFWTEFFISPNGFISFGSGSTSSNNQCPLPSSSTPNNLIALLWDDLDPDGNPVYYQSFGSGACPYQSYGGACLVVQFENFSHQWDGGAGTFEAILLDDSTIVIQFKNIVTEFGANSTTGIQGNDSYAGDGLTYACNTVSSISSASAIKISPPPIKLMPQSKYSNNCLDKAHKSTLSMANYSGTEQTFDLTYQETSGNGTLTGPSTLTVANKSMQTFEVTLTPDSLEVGDGLKGEVTATKGIDTYIAIFKTTFTEFSRSSLAEEPYVGRTMGGVYAAYQGQIWSIAGTSPAMFPITVDPPPDAEYPCPTCVRTYNPVTDQWRQETSAIPPFSGGFSYTGTGCQVGDTVYMYVKDILLEYYTGIWAYDMAENSWQIKNPSGTPPPLENLPLAQWIYDSEANLCYLTGNGGPFYPPPSSPAPIFVYDPTADSWETPLPVSPDLVHMRAGYGSWIVGQGNDKKLCFAGGGGFPGSEISSQCYDFSSSSWNAVNADLGALPIPMINAGSAQRKGCNNSEQLWMVSAMPITTPYLSPSLYFDVRSGKWIPTASGEGVLFPQAVVLNNDIYQVGGSVINAGYGSPGPTELLNPCQSCFSWPMVMPAIHGKRQQ